MALKVIAPPSYPTDNIQNQPDQVKDQAASLKLAFDQGDIDAKAYITGLVALLQELTADTSGAHTIGFGSTQGDITSDNVGDALDEIVTIAKDAQAGTILPNSITNDKLGLDNKVGSLALLDTVNKSDVVSAINELQAETVGNFTNLDILRIAELDTGVADAYVVDTPGTFNRVDGNTLPFIPANDNTGASTINEDGNGVATIQKYVDGAWVALEEGDLKKFQQTQLVWNASESAFQLAPKGGATIKSVQHITDTGFGTSATRDVSISAIDTNNSYVIIYDMVNQATPNTSTISARITSSTNVRLTRGTTGSSNVKVGLIVVEFSKIKSKQTGTTSITTFPTNVTISNIDLSKSILQCSTYSTSGSGDLRSVKYFASLTSSTNLQLDSQASGVVVDWQIIEF